MPHLAFPIGYLFLIFAPICLGLTTAKNITTDQDALLAFKNYITSNTLSRNWSASTSVCEWIGVTCASRHHRVTALNISYMGLSGTIPPQLGNLSFLVSLDISRNNFQGELRTELSHLRRLRVLNVSVNSLRGEIPSWIGSLHELQFLYLRNNTFTGSMPSSFSNLSNLEHLYLSFNSLQGSIPKDIGSLRKLNRIVIEYNQISDPIPLELFNISSLEHISLVGNSLSWNLPMLMCNRHRKLNWLDLSSNKLNGHIPPDLSQCLELQFLGLSQNEFGGFIPTEIGNLTLLEELYLSRNNLEGEIPSGLSQCSQLQKLALSHNELGGFIPKEIGNLKLIQGLYLGYNNLEGEIPGEIGNLTKLRILSMNDCRVSGAIPREFGNLHVLEELYLSNVSLTGSIPVEVFNLSTLSILNLGMNQLSGNLPSHICRDCPNLEYLFLFTNNLHGALPESISNCSQLKEIELRDNKFVGSIPNCIGNLRLLEVLDLGENHFTSYSPSQEHGFIDSLSNCKYLTSLEVDNNLLSGHLPESVGNLSTLLEEFYAYNCDIKGKIPPGFGNLSGLILLDLSGNQLAGSIPKTIKNLQHIQLLDFGSNKLNTAMLDKLCGLPKLEGLYVAQNEIFEPIPECLGDIASLRELDLSSNRFTSTIPTTLFKLRDILYVNLSTNYLSGSLPSEVGNLKVVVELDFSTNNFLGVIPNIFEGLQGLQYLSLAFNRFHGSIPESMDKLISLETLDLSHNNLSGSIPISFEKLQSLSYLNVSFNSLRGQIPNEGPFKNFTSESFVHNEALCGPQRFQVPPCPTMSSRKSRINTAQRAILITVGIVVTLGLLTFGLVCSRCRGKMSGSSGDVLSLPGAIERVSYYDLFQATDGYSEDNLIGSGGFGSVYRGTLKDGRTIAIKVFNLGLERAFKSFEEECQMLRNLRHRNLTKVISSCSNPDFKALVLEFMPNGDLDKWLHSDNFCLDMKSRLSIMIDVATALQYLHSGCSTTVIHCDLKPSNVLLDQEMVAHVSDFGIAKLLSGEDSVTFTATIATLGYIAPEYGLEGSVSTKCDVYSYGIMLMEVFTRIRPNDERFNGNFSLRDMVHNSISDALYQVVDATLFQDGESHNSGKLGCISSIMEIALTCTRESPKERITIDQVVNALNKIKTRLMLV